MAPELATGRFSNKADMYSFMTMAFEMLKGALPDVSATIRVPGSSATKTSCSSRSCGSCCVHRPASERPTAQEVLDKIDELSGARHAPTSTTIGPAREPDAEAKAVAEVAREREQERFKAELAAEREAAAKRIAELEAKADADAKEVAKAKADAERATKRRQTRSVQRRKKRTQTPRRCKALARRDKGEGRGGNQSEADRSGRRAPTWARFERGSR